MNSIQLSLTIMSDTLPPHELSARIGAQPTSSQTKGESRTQLATPYKRNVWTLEFGETSDVELKTLKQRCFDFISLHQAGLSQLTSQADVEAFLTFYVRTGGYHVGMELEIEEMKHLVASRIFPTFSVYSIAID